MDKKSPAFQCECRGFSDGGGLPGAAPPCGGALEASGSVSRPPAPDKSPYRESFPPSATAAVESGSTPPACRPLKRSRKIPGIPERVPGIFGWGSLPGAVPPCGSAPEASGSGKPDQLTPVLPAGTVRRRAGCVKSRSVQTFPHFAGRPVENRGRPGDRKNRLSQWNSRF